MRRLAAAKITTREACGNSVRNVTACPYAGVCPDEVFDVTPYSRALSKFLLGHPDCQNFGRKFKPAFSGCAQHACGLTSMHDMGFIATKRTENGKEKRGFADVSWAAGSARCLSGQAIRLIRAAWKRCCRSPRRSREFSRSYGEKKNRNRARIKFLVQDFGIEKFKELVLEERKTLAARSALDGFREGSREVRRKSTAAPGRRMAEVCVGSFQRWLKTNTRAQKQTGYVVVTVALPLGDITANQLRSLADIVRRFTKETDAPDG